jgi:hypothetical protein
MLNKLIRVVAVLPLFALALLPSVASAGSGPPTISSNTMSASFPGPNTRIGVSVQVPIEIVCSPVPSSFYGGASGNAQLTLVQSTPSGKAAVGTANVFLYDASSVGKGGGYPGFQAMGLICDQGIAATPTVNRGVLDVTPDTFTDPYTAALHGGQATATFNGQLCSYSYFGPTCDSVSGSTTLSIKQ